MTVTLAHIVWPVVPLLHLYLFLVFTVAICDIVGRLSFRGVTAGTAVVGVRWETLGPPPPSFLLLIISRLTFTVWRREMLLRMIVVRLLPLAVAVAVAGAAGGAPVSATDGNPGMLRLALSESRGG